MRSIPFAKLSGAGNDFVIIEPRTKLNLQGLARRVCHRTDGIGADGLLVLDKSRRADCRMRIFNADGTEAEMCGNGVRCLAAYLHRRKKKAHFSIQSKAGIIATQVNGPQIRVRLSEPKDFQPHIPLRINGRTIRVHYIDTGVPHVILYVDGLDHIDVNAIAPTIRYHKKFSPRGANVNFVEQLKPASLAVRTYERGVEGETQACGTGSAAAAVVTYHLTHLERPQTQKIRTRILTSGGETLRIYLTILEGRPNEVWLEGPVHYIAEGHYFMNRQPSG